MMRQYLDLKRAHPDAILLFRLGDFYEMFFEDAEVASRVLEITLTSRDKGEDAVPMCGVPWHSARGYIARLVEHGFKVAICEQVEDPRQAKGLVRREVVQVVTPGLVLDLEAIEAKAPLYLMALVPGRKAVGFAFVDVTTGEFRVGEAGGWPSVAAEVTRLEPREVLVPEGVGELPAGVVPPAMRTTPVSPARFDLRRGREALRRHFGVPTLGGFGVEDLSEGLRAAAAALSYVEENHRGALANLRSLRRHEAGASLVVDEASKRNLELFQTLSGERRAGTLLHLVDHTATAMGGRRLRHWLSYPLLDVAAIDARLDAVAELVRRGEGRRRAREVLRAVADVERLAGKVAMATANGRDLLALKVSLQALPRLAEVSAGLEAPLVAGLAPALAGLPEVEGLLERALADNPPAVLTEGGLLKDGFDPEVDDLRAIQRDGRGWIARLQTRERERTGIGSLKVGFNKVFGYYLEVTRTHSVAVPADYERRQTLANAERYVTPELKEMEAKVLGAEERGRALEYERFLSVRAEVGRHLDEILAAADALAVLDVLVGLAELAVERAYVRPRVHAGREIDIRGGKHPVVEASLAGERFVPNDVRLAGEGGEEPGSATLMIITGPNMAGKSTILRQTALTVILAQMGSFVPAEAATVGIVDQVFTRVGASDDLARGRSTFMVEMTETANILNNATDRSLVIVDEIGRGTSTFDGLSIAWAVAERLHELGARTLFATHYHELTDLARTLRAVANYNVAVKEWNGEVIFLRRLVEGGVSRSYGIHVARLAGLPAKVVGRAREILGNLEAGELDETGSPRLAFSARVRPEIPHRQLDLFQSAAARRRDRLVEEVAAEPVENLTPVEALVRLQELREKAKGLLSRGER
ncbi:MAG: DNA mismatch repair protein MutS [Deltaproteobacteria bacterium]|nr:DNA mismatch repair protein MutS [Deltaproteobacteria bacterium]